MAKEMIIIFVYDTQLLKKEEDDPASAILYFHPSWVSDQQRTALCGQIMGTYHCIKSVFESPKVISLQSGKFSMVEYGRYVLAVGSDRNIPNWVLEHRSSLLSSLISFYHNDLLAMAALYDNTLNFSAKLYHMFETYLKILVYGGNMFTHVATVQLPKSASNVFLEAIQILQSFQEVNSVLGGVILYHNKVVATQLSSSLTKRLILTDPYRIKSPAEIINVDFQLPLGVQLLRVYVDKVEYKNLQEDAVKCRSVTEFLNRRESKKIPSKPPPKEPVVSAMKRDQSLIFTSVPEEDSEHHSPLDIQNTFVKPLSRPKFLNLRNKTTDPKIDSINEINNAIPPSTPFQGQTSVCSTPMTDIKRVLHSAALSICTNVKEESDNLARSESVNSILSAVSDRSHTSLRSNSMERLFKVTPYVNVGLNLHDKKKSASMWEVREKLKSFAKRITMKYYNKGPGNLNRNLIESAENSPVRTRSFSRSKTITDPTFPLVAANGKQVSRSFYKSYLNLHMELVKTELNQHSESNTGDWRSFDEFSSSAKKPPENEFEMQPLNKTSNKLTHKMKKSLSLPLKSLTAPENAETVFPINNRAKFGGGVQLTPLMSKLSLLAFEERSSGFCSTSTTPSEVKDFKFTQFLSKINRGNQEVGSDDTDKDSGKELQSCVLFICGQQDMVVNMLLEESGCSDGEVVNKLWESCTECLGKLEKQLRHCLELCPGPVSQNSSEAYSFLCMDPEWDTLQRGGPWNASDLGALTHLHRDFKDTRNLMEIVLRDNDSIIYGHHTTSTEVYYHQAVSSNAGLPTPADPMGTVPQKAKRRLERDHSIMLL